jgi:hypothetical protein
VVSNRTKKYHHTRKGFAVYPSQRKFEKDLRPGINTSGQAWSKPQKSGTRDTSPFLKHGPEQRRGSGQNAIIRGDNRSNERFRNDTRHQINNRSSKNPGHVNQRMERRENSRRTRTGNNPAEIRGPGNNSGSVNAPGNNNPAIRENRRKNPVFHQNRTTTVRENRNPVVRENRRSVDRSRSFEGNRSFQGRDRSSFQRPDRSRQGSVGSWNRGDDSRGAREFRRHQSSGFSR